MFDHTKPFKTRDDREVTLLTTEGRGDSKYVGYIGTMPHLFTWGPTGTYYRDGSTTHDFDLVNTPIKVVRYLNLYSDETVTLHSSLSRAKTNGMHAIARKRVEITEGQFDD